MSELFTQIANFYGGDSLLKARFADLCFLSSMIGRSIISGEAIEASYSDKFMTIRRQFVQTSRLDSIVALSKLAAVMETKLNSIPPTELEAIDRMQKMLQNTDDLPKRLSDPNL